MASTPSAPSTGGGARSRVVVFFSPGWPPHRSQNGIVTYIVNLRPGLAAAGVSTRVMTGHLWEKASQNDVDLATTNPPRAVQSLVRAGAQVLPFHPIGLMMGCSIARCLNRVRKHHGLDLLEIEESFGMPLYVQQLVDVPVVVRLHGPRFLQAPAQGLPDDLEHQRVKRAEKACIARAVGLTAPAREVLERVRSAYGLPLPHARVIHNPVPPVPVEKRWTLEGSDRKTILFVGRFDRHKGGDVAIDAFVKLASALPQAELAFVGPDYNLRRDGRIRTIEAYLSEFVPAALRPRIHVLGPLPPDRIASLRRQAFVTIVPSRYEIFGLTLAESLAFGSPTIAANVGGMPEILVGDRTGLLFEAGNPADLAHQIQALFAGPTRAAQLGREAALDVSRRLSPEVTARETLDYYNDLWDRYRWVRRAAPITRAVYAFTGPG